MRTTIQETAFEADARRAVAAGHLVTATLTGAGGHALDIRVNAGPALHAHYRKDGSRYALKVCGCFTRIS